MEEPPQPSQSNPLKRKHSGCAFFLPRKKRCCHMEAKEEAQEPRLTCPYDKTHLVLSAKFEKHVKRCAKSSSQTTNPIFFSHSLNRCCPSGSTSSSQQKIVLSKVPKEKIKEVINKLLIAFKSIPPIETKISSHPTGSIGLTENSSLKQKRNAIQHGSFIGFLESLNSLSKDHQYVEWGCGRGLLSHMIFQWCKSDHILIDRANPRHKADRYLEYDTQLESVWKRLTIDIADLDFSKVETNPKKSMVWFSKHLCGCATDLTLKCAENYQKLKSDESQPVELIIIALCCHNRCTWDDFVGKEFFLEMGLDQSDFEIICKLASWAVSSKSSKNEEKEKEKEKTENQVEMSEIKREELIEDPEQIGIWAKRVIDYCRVKYFREQGFDVNLVHYVDFSVTPENTMLVATRRK